jgi:ubiquinone/menaquinone biosynthesis C-methylase UbiE
MSRKRRTKKEQIAEYFNGVAAPDFGVDARFFPAMGRRLVEMAQIANGARVLDVASGRGAVLFPAAEKVGTRGRVIGIDLAEAMVRETVMQIHRLGLTNAMMRRMDAEHLEFPDKSFDAVLCGFALFFFPQLRRALLEFHRVLAQTGVFAATTFAYDKTDERMSWYLGLLKTYGIYDIARPVPITRELDKPSDLQAELGQAGFMDVQVVQEEYDSIYVDEEEWWTRLLASGERTALEKLEPDMLKRFQADAFEKIQALKQPGGIHRPYQVLFALGYKPYEKSG